MAEDTKGQDVSQKITGYLQSYQDAARQLAGVFGGSGLQGTSATGETPEPVGQIADYQYFSGFQNVAGSQPGGDITAGTQKMMELWFQRPDVAYKNIAKFWMEMFRINVGKSDLAPEKDDHRFDDPAWSNQPLYKQAMQRHLAVRNTVEEWINELPVDSKEADRIRFALSTLIEATAPSNWPTNPAALKRYFETGGASAISGLKNLVDDIIHNKGMPSTVKRGALKVGKDMGNTPGKVVYRHEMFELIQYAPMTGDVYARPYLMVPPQINRFYFYDIAPKKSLIRFALESGLQTFTFSWRNPTEEHRDWDYAAYISAIDEALDVISEITGSPDCNIEGGCLAGQGVVGLLGDHANRGVRKVNSATLMVTLLDASVETQLGNLATSSMLEMVKAKATKEGVTEGSEVGKLFAMLRPNDLIWNYWVNNYLLGKDPPVFDVLAWNADTTRMAAGLHVGIVDLMKNNSMVRGEFKVNGKPIRLDAIDCDQYWMAGTTDHITPWQAVYASMQHLGGQREFVLSFGGHIQSMISSPNNPKAEFCVNPELPKDPEAWLAGATKHKHSWWLHWRDWITQRSGEQKKAPASLGSSKYQPLTDSPGTYVFE